MELGFECAFARREPGHLRAERERRLQPGVELRQAKRGQHDLARSHHTGAGKCGEHHGRIAEHAEHIDARARLMRIAHRHHALQLAVIDDRHTVGHARELVEVVRRDDDRAIRMPELCHDRAKPLRPQGIEPVRWLIKHDDVMPAQQRLSEPHALEVSLGEGLHRLPPMLADFEERNHALHLDLDPVGRNAVERRESTQCIVRTPAFSQSH